MNAAKLCLLIGLAALPTRALASACCAGSAALPALIAGDHAAQLSAAISRGSVIGDAPTGGLPVFRADGDDESIEILTFSGATLISDRWQLGATLPAARRVIHRNGMKGALAGLGDARAGAGFEALPEYEYSAWKPRGWAFMELTFPTGRNSFEETAAPGATGQGLWTVAAGMLLTKSISSWDALISAQLQFSAARDFETPDDGNVRMHSHWGTTLSAGGGYNAGPFRAGLRLAPTFREARTLESASGVSRGARTVVWNTSLEATWLASPDWSASISYIDQTLLGPAENVTLSRTFALSLQRRWER